MRNRPSEKTFIIQIVSFAPDLGSPTIQKTTASPHLHQQQLRSHTINLLKTKRRMYVRRKIQNLEEIIHHQLKNVKGNQSEPKSTDIQHQDQGFSQIKEPLVKEKRMRFSVKWKIHLS